MVPVEKAAVGANTTSCVQGEVGWARPLCSRLHHHLDVLFQGLAADTQQEVSRSILARLVFRIESTIMSKKFSALGGLLLERCTSSPIGRQLYPMQVSLCVKCSWRNITSKSHSSPRLHVCLLRDLAFFCDIRRLIM
jgi:hypothetical protein